MSKVNNQATEKQAEVAMPDEDQVVNYLLAHPDFFLRHSLLLNDLEVPHESGSAVSLVERQVMVLREKNQHFENKLREMVDAVHDNQRLHVSLHRLAVSLFGADGMDDLMGIVDDELRHKLGTDFVNFRLHAEDSLQIADEASQTYVAADDAILQEFAPLIEKNRIQCGRLSEQQIDSLFGEDAANVKSAAVIPVDARGLTGLIALGSSDEQRYHPAMGTDFLSRLADLISAAMKSQLASE